MAAATVDTSIPIQRESAGSLILHIVSFSALDDTNTYDSGISSGVVGYWANAETNEGTAGDEGINVAYSGSTFTFYMKTAATAAKLFILSRT